MIINNLLPGGLSDFFCQNNVSEGGDDSDDSRKGQGFHRCCNIHGDRVVQHSGSCAWDSLGKSVEFVLLILLILVSPSTCPIICEEWLWRPRWQPANVRSKLYLVSSANSKQADSAKNGRTNDMRLRVSQKQLRNSKALSGT